MTRRILCALMAGLMIAQGGSIRAADPAPDTAKVRAAELDAAKAGVKAAEVAVAAAAANLRRTEQQFQNATGGLASAQDVEVAKVAAANAERDLAVARLALARAGFIRAEPPGPRPNDKLKALQKEHLQSLRGITEHSQKAFRAGQATFDEVRRASLEQLQAEFDVCETPAERLDVLTRALKEARDLEGQTAERVKRGAAPEVELRKAKAMRLAAEIALERAGGAAKDDKAEAKPAWQGTIRVEGDKTKSELAVFAKVSLADAEKAALAGVPGDAAKTAVEVELEVEHGFLVYEVEVVVPGKAGGWSVVVDAGSGKVLAVTADPAEAAAKPSK